MLTGIVGVPSRSQSNDPRDIIICYPTVFNGLSRDYVASVHSSYGKAAFNVISRVAIIYYNSRLGGAERYRGNQFYN